MKMDRLTAVLAAAVFAANCGSPEPATTQTPAESAPAEAVAAAPEQPGGLATSAPPATEPSRPSASATAARPPAASRTSPAGPASTSIRNDAAPTTAASPAPAAPAPPVFREVTIPAGTSLSLELMTALSSETAQVESPVQARLRQAVTVDEATVLPVGTVVTGAVTDVERPGRVRGRGRLVFRFTEATIDGQREPFRTSPLTFEAESTRKSDATKIGIGAIGGAIVGGLIGGGDGAAKGAAAGGAAGTGMVLATRGEDVTVAAGTSLTAALAVPVKVLVPSR